jgi:hypothetical protein
MTQRLLSVTIVALLGCNEARTGAPGSEGAAAQGATASALRFGFKDLRTLDVVSGPHRITVEGPASPEPLELLADGKPVAPLGTGRTASLDTTKLPDGLVTVALAASRGGGRTVLASTQVVVLNRGAEAFFKNGSGGKVSVPPTGERPHQHLRYHFDLQDGVKRVLAVLTWEGGEGFDMELALGQGTCPHHGTARATRTGRSSPVSVLHAAPEGQTLAAGQWFAHVDLKNAAEVAGKEAPFSVKAFLLR